MYWRRRYRWRRRRPRWIYRRRFRRPFQRRWWRRKRWVRKRKLKKLKLLQWQPHYIRKLSIKGMYPMIMTTKDRLSNNLNCYLESIASHDQHGGGGFSICNFSLMTLYLENLQLRNWWTTSNDNMPLIRYLGCTITLYRQAELDYLFYYNNEYPMNATLTTYQSTHPSAMLLNKHTLIMTCKKHNRNKKPYKKIKIKPPSQLLNKWYFQYDIANTPLLQTMTTAASLDRMFLNSTAVSSTIGIRVLDTEGFLNHAWKHNGTSPYEPRPHQICFAAQNGEAIHEIDIANLTVLGSVTDYTHGTIINAVTPKELPTGWQQGNTQQFKNIQKKLYAALTDSKNWGNIFLPDWLYGERRMITTNKSVKELVEYFKDKSKLQEGFVEKTQKWKELRYNPFADKGAGNILYLIDIGDQLHSTDWTPPTNKDVVTTDLPLWALTWGYLDFQRKCKEYTDIDTNCIAVIQSPYFYPKPTPKFIVPLDDSFWNGHSPYMTEGNKTASDWHNWHPKVRFQTLSINTIATSGPATTKLPNNISTEAHIRYRFYFKIGGQPPPMSVLKKPDEQPKFPVPNNLLQTTSLQNPTTPFEYLLWNFDERRGELTKSATKRITEYQKPEKTLLPIAETSTWCPTISKKTQETPETSSTEEEETSTTEERIQLQRRKQKLLRKHINRILLRLTQLE
nr:MAG: ORF1 [TTV-like mini virus]